MPTAKVQAKNRQRLTQSTEGSQNKEKRKIKLKKSVKSPTKSPSVPRVSYLGTLFTAFWMPPGIYFILR